MSRYYQSSFRGANDYQKYRQEKVNNKKQDWKQIQTGKFLDNNNTRKQSYLQSSRLSNRQHLQTFGKDQTNIKDDLIPRERKPLMQYLPQKSFIRPYELQTENIQKYKYRQINVCQNQRSNQRFQNLLSNSQLISQSYSLIPQNSYARQKDSVKYLEEKPKKYQISNRFQMMNQLNSQNFQDRIISRNREFGNSQNLFNQDIPTVRSGSYNYSKKLNKGLNENIQLSSNFSSKQHNYRCDPVKQNKLVQNKFDRNIPSSSNLNVSPYKNRNEMIMQRLNVKVPEKDYLNKGLLRQNNNSSYQQKNPTTVLIENNKYDYKYQTTQVTPQKSQLTSRDQKNASQQRRKSLIEKSQNLKQKLNRLSTSDNKQVQNQQNVLSTKRYLNQSNSLNYTPKRYSTGVFDLKNQKKQNVEKDISKRLNFDSVVGQQFTMDKQNYQSSRQSQAPLTNSYQNNNNFVSGSSSAYKQSLSSKKPLSEDPLKKISQLNDKINNRLQSILKNYG